MYGWNAYCLFEQHSCSYKKSWAHGKHTVFDLGKSSLFDPLSTTVTVNWTKSPAESIPVWQWILGSELRPRFYLLNDHYGYNYQVDLICLFFNRRHMYCFSYFSILYNNNLWAYSCGAFSLLIMLFDNITWSFESVTWPNIVTIT